MLPVPMLFAVHIHDGMLGSTWLVIGFALTGLAALFAARRVRDEELPRIALLTAAFFVASSIHVRIGPTSVHLLLSGLVGVILAGRAPLAILIGVAMQAVLLAHGGWTTIGVNSLIQLVPALLAGWCFPILLPWVNNSTTGLRRSVGVGLVALLASAALAFGTALLLADSLRDVFAWSDRAGVVVSFPSLDGNAAFFRSPWPYVLTALATVGAIVADRVRPFRGEFVLGVAVGVLSVLLTTLLVGFVLISDGQEKWQPFATIVFVAHLPLALIEGLIVGTTVTYVARVKPEMLAARRASAGGVVAAGSALVILAALTPAASAHGMEAKKTVDRATKKVRVEVFYETGDAPEGGSVRVYRGDGSILAEGKLDGQGVFTFGYEKAESLRIVALAPGGHRAEEKVSAEELGQGATAEPAVAEKCEPGRWRDLLLGVTFVLALGAFVMSWRSLTNRREREASRAL